MELNQTIILEQLHFPEFNKNINIEQHKMIVFDSNCCYDFILGGDFLQKAGININYTECQIEWLNGQLPLRNAYKFQKKDKSLLVEMMHAQEDKEWFGDNFMELLATTILDATYNKVDLDKVISNQKNLTKKQWR